MRMLFPDSHWRSHEQKETQMEDAVVADGVLPGGSKRESLTSGRSEAGHLVMTLSCSKATWQGDEGGTYTGKPGIL